MITRCTITSRSVLEAIDTERAKIEVQNAIAEFDSLLEYTFGEIVLSLIHI